MEVIETKQVRACITACGENKGLSDEVGFWLGKDRVEAAAGGIVSRHGGLAVGRAVAIQMDLKEMFRCALLKGIENGQRNVAGAKMRFAIIEANGNKMDLLALDSAWLLDGNCCDWHVYY